MNGTPTAASNPDSAFPARAGAGSPRGFWQLLRLLLWMEGRTIVARVRELRRQSKLLLFVLFGFVFGYLTVGYWLFVTGLRYLSDFPVVGALLSQRVLFLIFGFFFLMLVFSNLITGYTTFFRNRETEWFVTLPVRHRHVFLWKLIESLVVSSWALLFLSVPLMVAYGQVHKAGLLFLVEVAAMFIPFTVIPAVLGAWFILGLVRLVGQPWVRKAILPFCVLVLVAVVVVMRPSNEETVASIEDVLSFEQLLRHTRITLNPYLPSAWMAQGVLAGMQDLNARLGFFFLLLLSYAAMGILIAYEGAGRLFYSNWSFALSHQSAMQARPKNEIGDGTGLLEKASDWMFWIPRPVRALAVKDIKVFWREPSQWTQFVVFFGLLCIYVLNLRNVAYDFTNPFWGTVISYLNLGASALTLSTLTTRFVFPQFSLEGRRLWIIGLAPLGLPSVLMQKFWGSTAGSSLITVTLMLVSSLMLGMSAGKIVLFCLAIALMSASLSALAVGLGAIFPNLRETNPSKIVSGFGGTLCLVASFVYIVLSITILALPAALSLAGTFQSHILWPVCLGAHLVMSLATILIPMKLAIRRVKNLEF